MRLTNRNVAGLAIVTAILALLVFFVADNFGLTEVRLFTVTFQVRLAWALVIAFGLGAVFGGLVVRFGRG